MEEEDCPKTRIFSGFFGFPRFRVAQIRKRWNACNAPGVVLSTLSCVRFTAVFPGFLQGFRIRTMRRTERVPLCEPRRRASPLAGNRSSHGAMKNVSASHQIWFRSARWPSGHSCAARSSRWRQRGGTLPWTSATHAPAPALSSTSPDGPAHAGRSTIGGSRRSPARCACSCIAIDRRA